MSVGDIKGARRRFRAQQRLGHAPRPKGRSVSESIEHNRKIALRMQKAQGQKKK